MIGGITKGSDFAGCIRYALALDEAGKEARLLHSEGVLTDTPQDIINGFECQRHLNSRVRHWCGHISLSYSPKDADRMTDEFMVKLALEYMEKMGIKNTQFIIAMSYAYDLAAKFITTRLLYSIFICIFVSYFK